MAQLKKEVKACTNALTMLRKEKKTAFDIFEDNPKLRELLKCEFDARLENDPYLSPTQKKAIRGQTTQKEEKQYER